MEEHMIYRTLGNSGLIVSALSLGTMQFGGQGLGNLGQKETDSMVRLAIDHGVNFIDTADIYARGQSETLLGSAELRGRGNRQMRHAHRRPDRAY
jgi:aryl-alcohol dehydrogenase-like predicted oxidoreductase